ncbi:MAG: LytR C-terminal domain-containing protein [Gemmatimonadaceae bacterium]|nr:LytR C-terminal domain-containing protein [Gemmatimonadaceae bacterium]
MTRARVLVAGAGLAVCAAGGWWWWRRTAADTTTTETSRAVAAALPRGARAPDSTRVIVEVLNASQVRGLGRRATLFLRDAGYDVVYTANDPAADTPLDSSVVIDRTGHPEWAKRVAKALGAATVETRPDSLRYVDLTVRLGRAWRPPANSLYP